MKQKKTRPKQKKGVKLQKLLNSWIPGTVAVQSQLDGLGINRQLMQKYVAGGWVKRIGAGAYSLATDDPTWLGAIYTLQQIKNYKLHIAGSTALELFGYNQYLTLGANRLKLLMTDTVKFQPLPTWLVECFKDVNVRYVNANLFDGPNDLGLVPWKNEKLTLYVSSPERAILEEIYVANTKNDLMHVIELLENLPTLRTLVLQKLLEHCRYHYVVRLFLAISKKINHPWFSRLDISVLDLGKGKYVLFDGGNFNKEYKISTPINLERDESNARDL